MSRINLLNHGFVRLVSYTQPVPDKTFNAVVLGKEPPDDLADFRQNRPGWSGDLEVVRNARTSYQASWRTGQDEGKDAKLIERLLLSQHTSPFEAMHFTFEVQAPIFVFRQWHRHRTWAYSEDSARYSVLPELYWLPELDQLTGQHKSDKQMRGEDLIANPVLARAYMEKHNNESFALYHSLMANGVAREIARSVLTLATYSHMFGTVSLGNLLKFLMLRIDKHAQHEIRVYAEAMRELVRAICPVTIQVFDTNFKVQQVVQRAIERARETKTGLIEIADVAHAMEMALQEHLEF